MPPTVRLTVPAAKLSPDCATSIVRVSALVAFRDQRRAHRGDDDLAKLRVRAVFAEGAGPAIGGVARSGGCTLQLGLPAVLGREQCVGLSRLATRSGAVNPASYF